MHNAPNHICQALRDTVIKPVVEFLVGQRPLRQVEHLLHPALRRKLAGFRPTTASVRLLAPFGQVLPGVAAIEAVVTVEVDGRIHALALRIEVRDGKPVIAELAAKSLGI